MDSLTYHINYSSKFINEVIHLGNELHETDLDTDRVKYDDVKKIIDLINQGTDTINTAINKITNIKEFDNLIPLKRITIKYLELTRDELDNEFRMWAMRLQYNPSESKLAQLQEELYPILDNALAMNEEFKETQGQFMKKYNITFE